MAERRLFLIRRIVLAVIVVCVLAGLVPFNDFDFDGVLDSLITEGILMVSAILTIMLLTFWISRFYLASYIEHPPFSLLTLPPPIYPD